jgi:hypothetical protein
MDNIIEQSRRNVYTKTTCPIDMDLDGFRFFLGESFQKLRSARSGGNDE